MFRFDEEFIENYAGSGTKEYILEVNVAYPKKGTIKGTQQPTTLTQKNEGKCGKLFCNLYDKKNIRSSTRKSL